MLSVVRTDRRGAEFGIPGIGQIVPEKKSNQKKMFLNKTIFMVG
jgi:hypothetical protein